MNPNAQIQAFFETVSSDEPLQRRIEAIQNQPLPEVAKALSSLAADAGYSITPEEWEAALPINQEICDEALDGIAGGTLSNSYVAPAGAWGMQQAVRWRNLG